MKVLLIVVYLARGAVTPDIQHYELESMSDCRVKSATIHQNVKVGRVNTVCWNLK